MKRSKQDPAGAEALTVSRDPSDPVVSRGKITPAKMSADENDAATLAERGVEQAQQDLMRAARENETNAERDDEERR